MIEPLHLEIIDDHYSLTLFYFFPCIFQCFCKKQVVFWNQENLNTFNFKITASISEACLLNR